MPPIWNSIKTKNTCINDIFKNFNLGVCSESTETLINVDDALFEVGEKFIKECGVQMKTTSGIKTFCLTQSSSRKDAFRFFV